MQALSVAFVCVKLKCLKHTFFEDLCWFGFCKIEKV